MEREGGGVGALEPTILEKVEKAAVLQETFFLVFLSQNISNLVNKGGGGGREGGGVGPSPKSAPVYSTAHKASI